MSCSVFVMCKTKFDVWISRDWIRDWITYMSIDNTGLRFLLHLIEEISFKCFLLIDLVNTSSRLTVYHNCELRP